MSNSPSIQRGQVMTEYALCISVLVIALLLPMGAEDSAAAQLAHSLRGLFRACSFLLSIS